jgi:hypothetical protein
MPGSGIGLQYVFGAEGWPPEAASAQVPSDANVSAATAAKKHVVCFISFSFVMF